MASERAQFLLPEGAEQMFSDFARLSGNPQWPALKEDRTSFIRASVRALFARCVEDVGSDWLLVKGAKSRQVAVREPARTSAAKTDVSLSEADRERVTALVESGVASSEAAVLRTALVHLHDIAVELAKGATLMRGERDAPLVQVDLAAIVLGKPSRSRRRFKLPLQTARPPLRRTARVEPSEAERARRLDFPRAKELCSLVFFISSYNRWLTIKVAELTRDAQVHGQQALAQEPVSDREEQTIRDREDRFDLINLLGEFKRARGELEPQLERALREHALLPEEWRSKAKLSSVLDLGHEVTASFLSARRSRLRGFPSEQQLEACWRYWTRSWDTDEKGVEYRECHAPIEWISVLHHWLARRLHDPSMVAHELQTLLLDVFGIRNSKHFAALPPSCGRLNRYFYGSETVAPGRLLETQHLRLALPDLLLLLEESAVEGGAPAASVESRAWARFLYFFLNITRTIRPLYRWRRETIPGFSEVEPRVRSLTFADLPELRARIFGAQTAIDGLHWVMRGGIVPSTHYGRAWLIHGLPGSGKSTLGAHLAADMARRGRVSIIVCSEERADAIEERLVMFGLRDDRRYQVVTREEFETILQDSAKLASADFHARIDHPPWARPGGLLVVFGASRSEQTVELATWLKSVAARARKLCELYAEAESSATGGHAEALRQLARRWRWMSVVVDSLDSLEVEVPNLLASEGTTTDDRSSMADLIRSIELSRFWGILLCGTHNRHKEALSYLADTVIEVGSDASGMHRRLQIWKCRTQPYDPGPHVLRIVEGMGVVVHPNLASIQRAFRGRVRPPLDRERIIPLPRRIFWPVERGRPQSDPPLADAVRPMWPAIRRGSAVLLYGPPQGGKTPFLLNLLSQRMLLDAHRGWRLGATGSVLIISFRGSEQDSLRPLLESKALGRQWAQNVSDIQLVSYGADETMRASRITHDLVRRIQRSQRDGVPLDWIAFVDLEALPHNLPLVAQEQSFWPTILSIAASENISTAFMVVASKQSGGFVAEYAREMDYVLRFSIRQRDNARAVHIEKSPDAPSEKGYPTVVFDPQDGPVKLEWRKAKRLSKAAVRASETPSDP